MSTGQVNGSDGGNIGLLLVAFGAQSDADTVVTLASAKFAGNAVVRVES